MTDEQIDRLVRIADPYDAATVRDLHGADLALLEEIMSTPTIERLPVERRRRALRSRLVTGVAVAAAMTAAIGVPTWLSQRDAAEPGSTQTIRHGDGSSTQVVYSAAAIKVAKENPRLLVDLPGWKATHAYGFARADGTIAYSDGNRELEMNWYPAAQYQGYYDDRLNVSDPQHVTVDGQSGALFTYSRDDFAVMLPPDGKYFVEMRTGVRGWAGKADFLKIVASVRKVTVESWLAAMPADIVTPDRAAAVAEEVLSDMDLPPGFDKAALADLGTNDRYQFGAKVAGRVACGWIAEWQRARTAGDTAAAQAAVAALQASHGWKILHEMKAGGDYPEVLWQYADEIATGTPPKPGLAVAEGYQQALGCD